MTTSKHEAEVLLVEDNARDAELALRALRKNFLADRVMHLRDGHEALEWLFARGAHAGREGGHLPKVVLLDLKLPKVSGLEVLGAIRGDGRTRALPVVVLTSSAEERDVRESYRLGVNSYIVKPVEYESFATTVAAVGQYWLRINHEPR
jgi:two-component system, response regulator